MVSMPVTLVAHVPVLTSMLTRLGKVASLQCFHSFPPLTVERVPSLLRPAGKRGLEKCVKVARCTALAVAYKLICSPRLEL